MAEPGEQDTPDTGTSERNTPNVTQPLDPAAPSYESAAPSAPTARSHEPAAPPASGTAPPATRARTRPDVLTLVVGLMSLVAAVLVVTGWIPRLPLFDLRWVLSGGAVVLGVLLLAASARSPRKRGQ